MNSKPRSSFSKANQGASPILDRTEMLKDPALRRLIQLEAQSQLQKLAKQGVIRLGAPHCKPVPPSEEPVYAPRMDLIDDPESPNFIAIFEVPGLKSSEISVELHPPFLEILGTRRAPYTHQLSSTPSSNATQRNQIDQAKHQGSALRQTRILLNELRFGRFRRCIKMPEWIKQSDIKASLAEGMLTVTWPRGPEPSENVISETKSAPTTPPRSNHSGLTAHIPNSMAAGPASQ